MTMKNVSVSSHNLFVSVWSLRPHEIHTHTFVLASLDKRLHGSWKSVPFPYSPSTACFFFDIPNEFTAVGAVMRLPEEGGHEFVTIDLMDSSTHRTATSIETFPFFKFSWFPATWDYTRCWTHTSCAESLAVRSTTAHRLLICFQNINIIIHHTIYTLFILLFVLNRLSKFHFNFVQRKTEF